MTMIQLSTTLTFDFFLCMDGTHIELVGRLDVLEVGDKVFVF